MTDAAAVIESLFCPADTTGHLFSELALTDGLCDAQVLGELAVMNPDEFSRLKFRPPLSEEVAMVCLDGGSAWNPSDEGMYRLLVGIFARHMEHFRVQRQLAQKLDGKQFAKLPGGHALVLWPAGSTLLRGKHVPDVAFEENPNFPAGAGQAARIIVGGCGPRFHRALQVIQRSSEMLYRIRARNVLGGFPEPQLDGKDGPYR